MFKTNYFKQNIFLLLFSLFFLLTISACKINDPDEDAKPSEPQWEEIPEFKNYNITYILKHESGVFVSCWWEPGFNLFEGLLFFSSDGDNWVKLRSFSRPSGPLAIKNDTLFCLSDSLHNYYIPNGSWGGPVNLKPFSFVSFEMTDIIFVDDYLYLLESQGVYQTFRINYKTGDYEERWGSIRYGKTSSKFLRHNKNGIETIYARGVFNSIGFFTFDGNQYLELHNGLTEKEIAKAPLNSMTIHNDTLFAGFSFPSTIKYLDNSNVWRPYTDSLLHTFQYYPPLLVQTTAIVFHKNRLFAATNYYGVLEWTSDKGWIKVQNGLKSYDDYEDLFVPIFRLETIGDYIIAGYDDSGMAYHSSQGLFKLKL